MASTSISTAFVKQYDSTLRMLLELKGNMFSGKCIEESINGEEKYYDQLSEAGVDVLNGDIGVFKSHGDLLLVFRWMRPV